MMTATVLDLATFKARRAAAAAARKAKQDPLSDPAAVLVVRQLLGQMIADQAGKMRRPDEY